MVFKKTMVSRVVAACLCTVLWAGPSASGNPLINLSSFFEDIFRVQLDGVGIIRRSTIPSLANMPPRDPSARRALHITGEKQISPERVSCVDFSIQGYSDWKDLAEKAKDARARRTDNITTPEMRLPNFWDWNSPVHVSLETKTNILGNLKSALVTVATLGHDFEYTDVIDPSSNKFSPVALRMVFGVGWKRYDSLFKSQLENKDIVVVEITPCTDFSIVKFEVR